MPKSCSSSGEIFPHLLCVCIIFLIIFFILSLSTSCLNLFISLSHTPTLASLFNFFFCLFMSVGFFSSCIFFLTCTSAFCSVGFLCDQCFLSVCVNTTNLLMLFLFLVCPNMWMMNLFELKCLFVASVHLHICSSVSTWGCFILIKITAIVKQTNTIFQSFDRSSVKDNLLTGGGVCCLVCVVQQ